MKHSFVRVMSGLLLAVALLALVLPNLQAAPLADAIVITVNSEGDEPDLDASDDICETGAGSGVCTLRAAIQTANRDADTDTIEFQLFESFVPRLNIYSALPTITQPVVVDGTSQPGGALVEVHGASYEFAAEGLKITAGESTVRGLVINGFFGAGILLETGGSNVIVGNRIGTNVDGTSALLNAGPGIHVRNSANNRIGGNVASDRNLISGNSGDGVTLFDDDSDGNHVMGNYIGTSLDGSMAIPNTGGVGISGASDNIIGGDSPAERNLISGNASYGVDILGDSDNNIVKNNYIGTNAGGTSAIPNGGDMGVILASPGPNNQLINNVISGNNGSGIELRGLQEPVIQGNLIGTTADGTRPLPNEEHGIFLQNLFFHNPYVIGGDGTGQGNTIRFNGGDGISIQATGLLQILGNRISDNGGLGIDNGADGVDENNDDDIDSTVDPVNYPVLTSVQVLGESTIVNGTLHSDPFSTFRLDFYSNTACDASGYGEGGTFLGAYLTEPTDESGNLTFTAVLPVAALPGESVSALNTTAGLRASEFSACIGGGSIASEYLVYSLDQGNTSGGSPAALNEYSQVAQGLGWIWQQGVLVELGTLPDASSPVTPHSINDGSSIVGQAMTADGQTHAFLWEDGAVSDLGTLPSQDPYAYSVAYGINNAGVIVGGSRYSTEQDYDGGPVKWENGVITELEDAPNCLRFCADGSAYDINDNGQIVGASAVDDYGPPFGYCCDHAALWDDSGITVLDSDLYTDSGAQDINELGQSVGYKRFFRQGYLTAPMLWNGAGGGTSLVSNEFDAGSANAINDQGVVVGTGDDYGGFGYGHAFVWTSGTGMVDLNTLLPPDSGWVLTAATDINEKGEIVGNGFREGIGYAPFLLRPANLDNLEGEGFVVTSTADDGDSNRGDGICRTAANECTLRAAIQEANENGDTSKIRFNIPGDGIPTISPDSALPEITKPMLLDAGTQPGCANVPCVELAGNRAGDNVNGLLITAGNSTVRGLIINRFDGTGIRLKTRGANKIAGNYIGTDTTGTARKPNDIAGIAIDNSPNNMIGGALADERNVLSGNGMMDVCDQPFLITDGNSQGGIVIYGNNADNNVIQGNYIGADKNGTASVFNSCFGIALGLGAGSNIIGGNTAETRNIISGNSHTEQGAEFGWGIFLTVLGGNTIGNQILGNYIGTDVTGTNALQNVSGIVAISHQNTIAGNVISGNQQDGINLYSLGISTPNSTPGNRVQGNLIGVDATGTATLGNGVGIRLGDQPNVLIGGTTPNARNVISGNTYGILGLAQRATGMRIQGNSIGTNLDGTLELGNSINGIHFNSEPGIVINIGGKQTGQGNMIAFNGKYGVFAGPTLATAPTVSIRGNSIFDNDEEGIVVVPALAAPTIKSSQFNSNQMKIKGSFSGEANKTYNLDFYANAECDTGEFGEGQTYLGSKDVTTNGSGSVNYEFSVSNVPSDAVITATATRGGTATGSFSRCRTMTAAADQAYVSTSGTCNGNEPCFDTIQEAIDAADPGGTVMLGEGTYSEDIVLNADVRLNMGEESDGGGGGGDNVANRKGQRSGTEGDFNAESAGDYIVNGSLTILDGEFQAPGTNLYLSGNLTLQDPGEFNNNYGTVILNGSGTQTVVGPFEFNNWTISSGVVAKVGESETSVNGEFVNQGIVQNMDRTFVDGSGAFRNFLDAARRRTARIRTAGSLELGEMLVTTMLNQTVNNQTTCANSGLPSNMLKRWFEVERVNGNEQDINADIRFYYKDAELNGALPETLKVYHCDESNNRWEALATTASSDSNGPYLQVTGVTAFSPFALGGAGAAPTSVTLSQFNAQAKAKAVRLRWRTATELSILGFNVWRKDKGGEFVRLNDELIAAKNPGGITPTLYKFKDAKVNAGATYKYRLELALTNGKTELSEIVAVTLGGASCGKPDAVTLLSPTAGEKTTRKLVLDWSDANCVETYELTLERGGKKQGEAVVNETALTTSQQEFNKLDKGKYKWRVRACNAQGCGEWTDRARFIVKGKAVKASQN